MAISVAIRPLRGWTARSTARSRSPRPRRSAALFRRPSKAFADAVNGRHAGHAQRAGADTRRSVRRRLSDRGGRQLIGAIGASGGIATQDGVIAKAGLDAITPH